MSNFKLQTSHPLIQSEQTFVLDRKVISVHSIDRDYKNGQIVIILELI